MESIARRIGPALVLLPLLALQLGACSGAHGPCDACEQLATDPCRQLAAGMFFSTPHHDCGPPMPSDGGVDGGVDWGNDDCRWTVSFEGDEYVWTYTDIAEVGTYICDDGLLAGENRFGQTREGYFDQDAGRLQWGGLSYSSSD